MVKEQLEKDSVKLKDLAAHGNYGEALSIVLNRAASASKAKNQSQIDTYLSVARALLVSAESDFGTTRFRQQYGKNKKCNFCGDHDHSKLLVGAEAVICRKCTSFAMEFFSEANAT